MVTGGIWFGDIPSYEQNILENNSPPPPKRNIPYISHSLFSKIKIRQYLNLKYWHIYGVSVNV
jgi:hypothetical protein